MIQSSKNSLLIVTPLTPVGRRSRWRETNQNKVKRVMESVKDDLIACSFSSKVQNRHVNNISCIIISYSLTHDKAFQMKIKQRDYCTI